MPYFAGPLQDRVVSAMKLPDEIDFVVFVSALSVFGANAALDDKSLGSVWPMFFSSSRTVGPLDQKDLYVLKPLNTIDVR